MLILASTSPARRALMDSLGVPYRAESPEVDEGYESSTPPKAAVALLAERKARAVLARHPDDLIIGADQLAICAGKPLGKPADRDAAREQLKLLREKPHEIATGLCVVGKSFFEAHVDVARIRFHAIGDDELERYLDTNEWQGCAGGYRVEAKGQALFAELDGDRTGVQGLPMLLLVKILRRAGMRFF